MKKLLSVIIVVFAVLVCVPCFAQAGPFVRCDQYTANPPDYFKYKLDTGTYVQSPVFIFPTETGPAAHIDLSTVSVGAHSMVIQACKAANPPWQPTEVCTADSSPLAFSKPAPVVTPTGPANLRLVAQ